MRNTPLHSLLGAFAVEAAEALSREAASGADIPFELVEEAGRRRSGGVLYCYRPLTADFIRQNLGLLCALPTYTPAARALALLSGVDRYLRERAEPRIPAEARERSDAALRSFLAHVFDGRSEFTVEASRFETAYALLEGALYDGQSVTTVIAPLFGVQLAPDSTEVPLGDGLSLIRGEALSGAPAEAVWADAREPNVLVSLTVVQARSGTAPISQARTRFRRLLTALRLYERGGYALGPLGWSRADTGAWRPAPLGGAGRPGRLAAGTQITAEREDELRAFCSLIARRMPGAGELSWALSRYEMGCERLTPFEALTDHLLALRALLEPEGPSSGRLAGRLAAICARSEERAVLAERVAHAISLERAVIAGLAPANPGADGLVEELADHLRALLRDAICGHLDHDLCAVADGLLAEAAALAA